MAAPSLYGITMPEASAPTLRAVIARRCQILARDYLALPRSAERTDPGAVLAALLREEPRCVVRALRRPTVAVLLGEAHRVARASTGAEYRRARRRVDLTLLAELAGTGELPREIAVAPDGDAWPTILSIASRTGGAPPPGATLVFGPRGVDLAIDGARRPWARETTCFPIEGNICLAVRDDNPMLHVQAHPERAGNVVDLGGEPLGQWLASLREALAILREHAPHVHEEMRLALEIIVPTGHDAERHFSVSYPDAVGAVYMSLHPNVMTLAEALIHEWQHNKLNAVLRWDPLLADADGPRFASPVRPDPRPLRGVLMAVHAFLPVAMLYERMTAAAHPLTRGRDGQNRFREIVAINREAAAVVLTHGRPTRLGAELLDEIRAWDRHYVGYAQKAWES
jgi:HEXXH motif-containing protein